MRQHTRNVLIMIAVVAMVGTVMTILGCISEAPSNSGDAQAAGTTIPKGDGLYDFQHRGHMAEQYLLTENPGGHTVDAGSLRIVETHVEIYDGQWTAACALNTLYSFKENGVEKTARVIVDIRHNSIVYAEVDGRLVY